MSAKITLPPTLHRYELKYVIPYAMVKPIQRFIAPYCEMDYHSTISPDTFYTINSLYFDTRNCEFLEQRLWGRDLRFNMRVRFYGGTGAPPYHLEIKQKMGVGVKKTRATIGGEEWPHILTDPYYYKFGSPHQDERIANKDLFMRLAKSYEIEPKIMLQYRRCAFFSTVDKYARVTMDRDMRYREQDPSIPMRDPYNMKYDGNFVNYDNETIYAKDTFTDANVILELKCDIGYVPMWMLDLVKHFELNQVGFSKYLNASLVAKNDNGLNFMAHDRMSNADFMFDDDPTLVRTRFRAFC
ncbi:MAG: polyphosphate polymerase domain-containing protein [Alphaproteobacteria bacterium]|nr:polyphosphate polymerase domain-containing protein [Alphaproteobacteria bacterium]